MEEKNRFPVLDDFPGPLRTNIGQGFQSLLICSIDIDQAVLGLASRFNPGRDVDLLPIPEKLCQVEAVDICFRVSRRL